MVVCGRERAREEGLLRCQVDLEGQSSNGSYTSFGDHSWQRAQGQSSNHHVTIRTAGFRCNVMKVRGDSTVNGNFKIRWLQSLMIEECKKNRWCIFVNLYCFFCTFCTDLFQNKRSGSLYLLERIMEQWTCTGQFCLSLRFPSWLL